MKALRLLVGFLGAVVALLLRATIRVRVVDDPRPDLYAERQPFCYGILHAHQVAAIFVNPDRRIHAMLSRSADADFFVPLLRLRGALPIRGSTRKAGVDKGGRAALGRLCEGIRAGCQAIIAVDGPRGPRNHVHRGIADLAVDTGAPIVPGVVIPSRRWILGRTWDRFQIPKPFCTLTLAFAPPIRAAGRAPEAVRQEVAAALSALERRHDPLEAERAQPRTEQPAHAALPGEQQ